MDEVCLKYFIERKRVFYSEDYIVIDVEKTNNNMVNVYFFRSSNNTIYFRVLEINTRDGTCTGGNYYFYLPFQFFQTKQRRKANGVMYGATSHYYEIWSILKSFQNAWKRIKQKSGYFEDHTIHQEGCKDPLLYQLPILTPIFDLVCSFCRASVDIEWHPHSTYLTQKLELLWVLWTNADSLVQWILEEVLLSIISIFKK
jgi:hypothetical protein